jgi:hypothetical protein
MSELDQEEIVKQAKPGLKRNPCGGFREQPPHLYRLLENLPVLGRNSPTAQNSLGGGAVEIDVDSVLEHLKGNWVCSQPSGSHDGAINAEVGEESDHLILTFHLFLWSRTTEVRRFEIVRVGEESYLYWDRGQLPAVET